MSLTVTEDNIKLFMKRLRPQDNGCIHHCGSLSSSGYPQAAARRAETGRTISYPAHRIAWIIAHKSDPGKLFVCHRCNNKLCVRLEHLYVGTHKMNMDDVARTMAHPKRKLSSVDVMKIRSTDMTKTTQRALAKEFGVSQRAISYILKNVTYRYG